ncbi:MAG: DUF1554 domain-containing protein [Leptospiraceae bacterium]|nr:DUF1554 domain-containing protein [Leptospiraceae bacterium]
MKNFVTLILTTLFIVQCTNEGMWDQIAMVNPAAEDTEVTVTAANTKLNILQGSDIIVASTGSYDFGSIGTSLSPSGSPVEFTLSNTSTDSAINVSSVTVTGANAADFKVIQSFTGEIAAQLSASIRIVFVPQGQGSRSASITVTSNDEALQEYTFTVTGTGNGACAGPFNPGGVKRMFVTTLDSYTGNLGGVTGADRICMLDAIAVGAGGCFKAVLGHATDRNLNTNWIMQPDKEYFRIDGTTKILTTNAQGGLTNDGSSPCSGAGGSYALCNSLSTSGHYWTGLNANWSVSSSRTCSGWGSDASSVKGRYGMANQTNNLALQGTGGSNENCNNTRRLLCVEI